MKITGTPHPDGSCAWRAGRAGHEDRIGVARNRYTPNPLPEWWAWCGRCNWVPLGPGGEGMHRTWQEAQDAAAAHADRHLRINGAVCPIHPRLALGPQADQLIALFDTAARLTGDKPRDLAAAWYAARDAAGNAAWYAARNAAWYAAANAARNAAWYAARDAARNAVVWDVPRNVVYGAAGNAARNAASDAAGALVVRDCLPQEHYERLTRPWRAAVGALHPDDEDPT